MFFACQYDEILGIDLGLVSYSLNVKLGTIHVVQPMRTFHTTTTKSMKQNFHTMTTKSMKQNFPYNDNQVYETEHSIRQQPSLWKQNIPYDDN